MDIHVSGVHMGGGGLGMHGGNVVRMGGGQGGTYGAGNRVVHWGHAVAHLCMGGTGRLRGRAHEGKLHGGPARALGARGGNLHGGLRMESEIDIALTYARPPHLH